MINNCKPTVLRCCGCGLLLASRQTASHVLEVTPCRPCLLDARIEQQRETSERMLRTMDRTLKAQEVAHHG